MWTCMCLLSCSSRPVWLFRQRLQIQLLVLDRPTCYPPTDTNPSTPYATISLPPRALIHPLAEFETLNLKLAAQSLYLKLRHLVQSLPIVHKCTRCSPLSVPHLSQLHVCQLSGVCPMRARSPALLSIPPSLLLASRSASSHTPTIIPPAIYHSPAKYPRPVIRWNLTGLNPVYKAT